VTGERDTAPGGQDIVLVHGAMHGAWCWDRVVPRLEADPRTRRVVAVDLPGTAANPGPVGTDEITVDHCVDHVVHVVEAADLRDIVLVGHSLGGITITPAAHRLEERMHHLVCLTSIHPPAGRTVLEVMFGGSGPAIRIPEAFTTDFDAADAAWLTERLVDQPTLPLSTPIVTATAPASVPVTYVRCGRDEALPPAVQTEQARRMGAEVVDLDAGHSPFVTHVAELTEIILNR
jgi:pimeloyl-ACP methyl ester carboxylesterase